MAQYFQLSDDDIVELAAAFSVKPRRWEYIAAGDANTSYLLTADIGDLRYVLTVLRDRMDPDNIVKILETVFAHGIPVGAPLRTVGGATHTVWQGHNVILKPFIEGTCGKEIPLNLLAGVGSLMARIHLLPPPPGALPCSSQLFPLDSLDDAAASAPPEIFRWWKDSIVSTEYVEGNSRVPRGLAHGDFWGDNIVLTSQRELVALDWTDSGVGSFVYDIAYALPGLVLDQSDYRVDEERLKTFMEGYESVRSFLPEEKEIFSDAVLRAAAIISCKRFIRHYVLFPDPSHHDPNKYGKYEETVNIGREAHSLKLGI